MRARSEAAVQCSQDKTRSRDLKSEDGEPAERKERESRLTLQRRRREWQPLFRSHSAAAGAGQKGRRGSLEWRYRGVGVGGGRSHGTEVEAVLGSRSAS